MGELTKEQAVEKIRRAGVVGAGGAGFPTYVKAESRVEVVIANGAECEPLIFANKELMKNKAQDVLFGLTAMVRLTGAQKGILAVKKKHAEVLAEVKNAASGHDNIEIFPLGDYYPAGDEHVLVYEITGRVIPEAGIPLDVGVVVNNVETLYNVARALDGHPVTEKYVTVTGEVKKPFTVLAPIGTPLEDLLPLGGGPARDNYAVLEGGPMMGKLVEKNPVVTKTTSSFILLPQDHELILTRKIRLEVDLSRAKSACCQCRYCTELCPRYLLGHNLRPDRAMTGLAYQKAHLVSSSSFWLCSECGLCEAYACVMKLSPRRINSILKQQGVALGLRIKKAPGSPRPKKERNHRLVPTARLILRLGLKKYDVLAPLTPLNILPEQVKIPLKQHTGAPARPVVKKGEKVHRGQLIADLPPGMLGAPVHASLTGRVLNVNNQEITIARD